MDVNILNQFILATDKIFQQLGDFGLQKLGLERLADSSKIQAKVATILGLTGSIKGQLVFTMEEPLAMKLASSILMGAPVNKYNEVAESGFCETVNMVAGEAARRLGELGFQCELSVPSILRGNSIEIGFQPPVPIFLVRFTTKYGPVQMLLALQTPRR